MKYDINLKDIKCFGLKSMVNGLLDSITKCFVIYLLLTIMGAIFIKIFKIEPGLISEINSFILVAVITNYMFIKVEAAYKSKGYDIGVVKKLFICVLAVLLTVSTTLNLFKGISYIVSIPKQSTQSTEY